MQAGFTDRVALDYLYNIIYTYHMIIKKTKQFDSWLNKLRNKSARARNLTDRQGDAGKPGRCQVGWTVCKRDAYRLRQRISCLLHAKWQGDNPFAGWWRQVNAIKGHNNCQGDG